MRPLQRPAHGREERRSARKYTCSHDGRSLKFSHRSALCHNLARYANEIDYSKNRLPFFPYRGRLRGMTELKHIAYCVVGGVSLAIVSIWALNAFDLVKP